MSIPANKCGHAGCARLLLEDGSCPALCSRFRKPHGNRRTLQRQEAAREREAEQSDRRLLGGMR